MSKARRFQSWSLIIAGLAVIANCSTQGPVQAAPKAAEPQSTLLSPVSEASCRAAIAYSDTIRGVSVLVLHNGKVVCEGYSGAGGPNVANELWSGTKSFSGVMAAIAAKDGLLTLDERVAETAAEWAADPLKSQITIRHLLSLTSGLVSGAQIRAEGFDTALNAPVSTAPGTAFAYGPAHYQAFGAIMSRKLQAKGRNGDPATYLRETLLDPLGINSSAWRRTQSGDIILPHGMALTARDWAKFGEFVRSGGRLDGRLIVDPIVFAAQFQGSAVHAGYGLTWWLPRASNQRDVTTMRNDLGRRSSEFPSDMVVAGGAGDQRLYVIPSLNLTIVRQAAFDVGSALNGRGAGRDGANSVGPERVGTSRDGRLAKRLAKRRAERPSTGAQAKAEAQSGADRWSDATFITTLLAR